MFLTTTRPTLKTQFYSSKVFRPNSCLQPRLKFKTRQWGRPFGRAPQEICPAISTHPHWGGDCTTAMRWQDAGAEVTCSKCHTSNSLSFSTGPIASSFTAETFALKQGLNWCTNHLMTCKFQSVLFLTDSQSALSILSSAPSYLLPESLWNVWSLASSLCNNTTLNFQWVPGHAGLPGNEKAELLAKAGASLPTDAIPCSLPQSLRKLVISSTAIGDVTSPTLI